MNALSDATALYSQYYDQSSTLGLSEWVKG